MSYCVSRFHTIRRQTVEVKVGPVGVGGANPIRVQSMTTSDTQDIEATVKQSIALAEVGCEIVRVTAPNVPAAKCLKDIRARLSAAGFANIPLVADIHFLPNAAMEAVEHVEKVRVNPGNYADKKKFAVKEYTDGDYDSELQRLHDSFSPLVKRCKALGRALRIGTNHGSLSDRIMNRYGDTPLGMVESALEFVRIAESHGFHDIILSMKASNPKVMIQAYRLLVEKMDSAHRAYPLHLGVTEAGDGEDGRIKSAIGIGSLLLDGLGDTIRVSLTEDSVYEIPVARSIADKAMSRWSAPSTPSAPPAPDVRNTNITSDCAASSSGNVRNTNIGSTDACLGEDEGWLDPFTFVRRETAAVQLAPNCLAGPEQPPRVIVRAPSVAALPAALGELASARLQDTPAEGVLVTAAGVPDLAALSDLVAQKLPVAFLAVEAEASISTDLLRPLLLMSQHPLLLVRRFVAGEDEILRTLAGFVRDYEHTLALKVSPQAVAALAPTLRALGDDRLVFTCDVSGDGAGTMHAIGRYRQLAAALRAADSRAPIWIRNTAASAVRHENTFLSRLLEASFLTGSLLCDGLGDLVSIETESDVTRATKLAYNVLQGAGARISKTEFVACPSCGRTLFDLQTTTQRIRAQTGHLKGVKIAIMGCIVNGPGEMADADFGYVGGAPGKINLYVGKNCVQYNIPQAEADARLIALIREHGKWVDPEPHQLSASS